MFSRKALLKEIADNSVYGVIVTDKAGIIKGYNHWCVENLDWQPDVQTGEDLNILSPVPLYSFHASQQLTFPDFFNKNRNGAVRLVVTGKKGKSLPVQIAIREVENEGDVLIICYVMPLSQHQISEEKRKVLQQRVSALASSTPGIIFQCGYEKIRPIIYIDDTIEELSGLPCNDFLSGKVQYSQLVRPEDEKRIWHAVGLALQQREPYTVEYQMLHRSGKTTWVSEKGEVVRDENGVPQSIIGIITDNTLIKALNDKFDKAINVFDKATATIEFDLAGCVITANNHFLKLFDYDSIDEILGHHHRLFCLPEHYASTEYEQFWKKLREGQPASGEYLRVGKNGKRCWIQATYTPILDAAGKPCKIKKFVTDLGKRKAMEQELRVAGDKAKAAVAAQRSFMTNISHEMKTPLYSITGLTELLLKSPLNKEQSQQLRVIHNASCSLQRLLDNIHDMPQLEKDAITLEINDFNIMDLCRQTIQTLRFNAEQKGLDLLFNPSKDTPAYIKGDSLRIQQVLLNILGNVIEFTEQGSLTLNIQYREEQLHIQVVDTGMGIDQVYLKRFFDPFTQAEIAPARRVGDSGLGAAVARKLVELMGGTIKVESKPNVGTTFSIAIPAAKGEAPKKLFYPKLDPIHVLAVDNMPDNLQLIKEIMLEAGHKVDLANTGEEAVEICKKQRYDLVLMDMQMTGMDGLEATGHIRAYEKEKRLPLMPVIASSANILEKEKDQQNAVAAGMQGFTIKPFDAIELLEEIRRVLAESPKNVSQQAAATKEPPPNPSHKEPPASESEQKPSAKKKRTQSMVGDIQKIVSPGGINWKAGVQLLGDEQTLIHSIKNFLQNYSGTPVSLADLLTSRDFEQLSAQAHNLCRAAGNLNLYRVHKLAKDIEIAAQQQKGDELTTVLPSLDKAIQAVASEIEEKQRSQPEQSSSPQSGIEQNEQIREELQAAIITLMKNEVPEERMKILAKALPQERLAPLQEAIQAGDFKLAVQKASELEETLP